MNRKAFNSAGCLGFFYDGYHDQVINQSKTSVQVQKLSSSELPRCQIVQGNRNANFNFLQIIDVENELRLSSLLVLKKRIGIAEVLNYSHCIDEYTRVLYYSWICRTEKFHQKNMLISKITGVINPPTNATHIITSISVGIDLLIVLQLPLETDIIRKIDHILEKIRVVLLEDKHKILNLTIEENDSLEKILTTTVYSNVPILTDSVKLFDILNKINTIKRNTNHCHPVAYTLQPITSLYSVNARKFVTLSLLTDKLRNSIEEYILRIRNRMKYVEGSLHGNLAKLLSGHLEQQMKQVHNQCSTVKKQFKNEIQRFLKLVIDARHGQKIAIKKIDQALKDHEAIVMENSIATLVQHVDILKAKGQLITDLRLEGFEYLNSVESNLYKCNDLRTIEKLLIHNNPQSRILCSSDTLNQVNNSKLIQLRQILIEEHKNNPTLRLYYLDFSYSSFSLQSMIILPLNSIDQHETLPTQSTPLQDDVSESFLNISSSTILTDDFINILLLGETGVGKSTFINAFANYLTYDSLDQAQENEPVVLIPVSFIMTIGDNFEEREVKFGEFDSTNNEHFNNVGQSVTQHCKSYVFDLHQFDNRKLRIIDTPGFGDTRGLDQDEQNMEHILQYMNNLTYLNAICFLLKPNSTRLNIFFRTCLTQLFSFLAPTARKNIIFCFTNARSTFYTPGDTAPLLKTMLESLSIDGILFEKQNTFCFDSESFRYLVALQDEISFPEQDKHEYEKSWSTSVKESNRLIEFIDTKLNVYRMESGWQSIKHAQFEISYMIRPILETIKNIRRNQIIYSNKLSHRFIELFATSLRRASVYCRSCKPDLYQVGKFWIAQYLVHEVQTECQLCLCAPNEHVSIDCVLEYKLSNDTSEYDPKQMTATLTKLCEASTKLAHFLMDVAHSTKADPFLNGLTEMIEEENNICQSQKQTDFNKQLVEELKTTQNFYKQLKNHMILDRERNILPTIYDLIAIIKEYSPIHKQMSAVKKTQQNIMEEYEYEAE